MSVRSKVKVRTEVKRMPGKKSPILKAVDKSAKAAAAHPWRIDRGFASGKVGRSKTGRTFVATLFPAEGQKAIIRIYRTRLIGRSDHKIYFEVFCEQSGRFVLKACAFTSPEIAVDLHRHHVYQVLFNANPKYPIIEQILQEVLAG